MADYVLASSVHVVSHYRARRYFVYDRARPSRPDIDVAVRSGDYFVTLATSLETLASTLPDISTATASQLLAKVADELSYVQTRYTIVRKQQADDLTELG